MNVYVFRWFLLAIGSKLKITVNKDKELKFGSLAELVKEFQSSYTEHEHQLMTVKIGGAVPSDTCSQVTL